MKEHQYEALIDRAADKVEWLGLMANDTWQRDPRRMAITLSRYKFVSKMLAGKKKVAELGCGDGFASRIVKQTVDELHLYDFDKTFIDDIYNRMHPDWPVKARVHDILDGKLEEAPFDAIFSLDVMEHIRPEDERKYLRNIAASLHPNGVFIVGMPSLESQKYASAQSRTGHINCHSGDALKDLLGRQFHNVFLFSMNDEVIHTGFYPMAHYLMGVCCGVR